METFSTLIGDKKLEVIIKDLAEQANGNVLVRYGDTEVLATCVMSKSNVDKGDFFPLIVEFEERFYAAGKIRGARYIRRESKPSDEAILNARLIDRSIRPLFPKDMRREVQVVITVLSWDATNDPDFVGILAASLALSISDIPWKGPLAAARVAKKDDAFLINPAYSERETSQGEIIFAAVKEKEGVLINMMEGGFDQISENVITDAFKSVQKDLEGLIAFQQDIAKKIGKEKAVLDEPQKDEALEKEMKDFLGEKLKDALFQTDKSKRDAEVSGVKESLFVFLRKKHPENENPGYINRFFDEEINEIVHKEAIFNEKRVDGRKLDELREISCEAGILPRTHGSGLFVRGQTKALSILTLGSPGDQQILESMETVGKKRFMHHYNFPPYSSGEIKPMRGPGRREIGHGMLAEKALFSIIPPVEEFPYTIRIVTEILSSNGSTSMAAVSASSLALMDAGVPIKKPVTGIALGLMSDESGKYKILTDIQGPEDHHGDMDFKVAGTRDGICAIQMDVKIKGITAEILKNALDQSKKARLQILEKIEAILSGPRPQLSPYAPRIVTLQINPDRIRDVVGPGGKVINEIIDECAVSIDIEDDGEIFITGESEDAVAKAVSWIKNITHEVKVGEIFQGKVKRIMNFGAFAEILPGQEGLVHISQLADYHVNKVEDVVKIGQMIPVKVISIDEQGRINLSLKEAKEKK